MIEFLFRSVNQFVNSPLLVLLGSLPSAMLAVALLLHRSPTAAPVD